MALGRHRLPEPPAHHFLGNSAFGSHFTRFPVLRGEQSRFLVPGKLDRGSQVDMLPFGEAGVGLLRSCSSPSNSTWQRRLEALRSAAPTLDLAPVLFARAQGGTLGAFPEEAAALRASSQPGPGTRCGGRPRHNPPLSPPIARPVSGCSVTSQTPFLAPRALVCSG